MRKFGYSLRGKPAKALRIHCRGKHLTARAALNIEGILDCSLVTGGVNSETFQEFIIEKLVPKLQPYNGTNTNIITQEMFYKHWKGLEYLYTFCHHTAQI